jgi:quinol monooxygenase YgiN
VLIIAGTIRIDAAQRDATLAAAREMMTATRKEKGCHAYSFTADLDDPTLVHLFERWESDADLKAHFATPHMARFQAAIQKLPAPPKLEIAKYEISSVGSVR